MERVSWPPSSCSRHCTCSRLHFNYRKGNLIWDAELDGAPLPFPLSDAPEVLNCFWFLIGGEKVFLGRGRFRVLARWEVLRSLVFKKFLTTHISYHHWWRLLAMLIDGQVSIVTETGLFLLLILVLKLNIPTPSFGFSNVLSCYEWYFEV